MWSLLLINHPIPAPFFQAYTSSIAHEATLYLFRPSSYERSTRASHRPIQHIHVSPG